MQALPKKKLNGGHQGFSLVELLIALSMGLVLAATSVPITLTALAEYRLRASATSVAALIRSTRSQAIESDVSYSIRSERSAQASLAWTDLNRNGSHDASEPAVHLIAGVTISREMAPSLERMGLDYTPQPADRDLSFNARGVPCVVIGTSCRTTSADGEVVGYLIVLRQERTDQHAALAAVSVSPTGRIQQWRWDGTDWKTR